MHPWHFAPSFIWVFRGDRPNFLWLNFLFASNIIVTSLLNMIFQFSCSETPTVSAQKLQRSFLVIKWKIVFSDCPETDTLSSQFPRAHMVIPSPATSSETHLLNMIFPKLPNIKKNGLWRGFTPPVVFHWWMCAETFSQRSVSWGKVTHFVFLLQVLVKRPNTSWGDHMLTLHNVSQFGHLLIWWKL